LEERGHPPVTFAFSFLPGIPFIHTQPDHETRSHRTLLVDRLLILALSRNSNIYNSRTYVPTYFSCISKHNKPDLTEKMEDSSNLDPTGLY